MSRRRDDDGFERGDQPVDALRWKVEPEVLDRDQPLAIGIVSAEHRAQRAGANLMKDPE